MKVIRFVIGGSPKPNFGVVIRDRAIAFSVLQGKTDGLMLYLTPRF